MRSTRNHGDYLRLQEINPPCDIERIWCREQATQHLNLVSEDSNLKLGAGGNIPAKSQSHPIQLHGNPALPEAAMHRKKVGGELGLNSMKINNRRASVHRMRTRQKRQTRQVSQRGFSLAGSKTVHLGKRSSDPHPRLDILSDEPFR